MLFQENVERNNALKEKKRLEVEANKATRNRMAQTLGASFRTNNVAETPVFPLTPKKQMSTTSPGKKRFETSTIDRSRPSTRMDEANYSSNYGVSHYGVTILFDIIVLN